MGGDIGDFRFNGDTIDWARRPPGIAHLSQAWCIYVQNDSMAMWRSPGELVYAHPTRPAKIGDHVIVEMMGSDDGTPGDALLKKLVRRTATKLVLAQYNPPRDDIEIDIRSVKQVWRVFEWSELLGV